MDVFSQVYIDDFQVLPSHVWHRDGRCMRALEASGEAWGGGGGFDRSGADTRDNSAGQIRHVFSEVVGSSAAGPTQNGSESQQETICSSDCIGACSRPDARTRDKVGSWSAQLRCFENPFQVGSGRAITSGGFVLDALCCDHNLGRGGVFAIKVAGASEIRFAKSAKEDAVGPGTRTQDKEDGRR